MKTTLEIWKSAITLKWDEEEISNASSWVYCKSDSITAIDLAADNFQEGDVSLEIHGDIDQSIIVYAELKIQEHLNS